MAIDNIQSLQRQLNEVEKKVCTFFTSACRKICLLEIRASLDLISLCNCLQISNKVLAWEETSNIGVTNSHVDSVTPYPL